MLRRLYQKSVIRLGMAIGAAICEPQLRLGRRRHDGACDNCETVIDRYACERLRFPERDHTSTIDHIRKMLNAEYERLCLECSAAQERGE